MRLAVSGSSSSGRAATAIALSHYTGMPCASAPSETLPGLPPTGMTPAQFLQLTLRRHTARAVQEALLGDHFVSDGSSLQEWLHGAARAMYGMDPAAGRASPIPDEMVFFVRVVEQYGQAIKQHVKATYDGYIHLPAGPPTEPFRATMDRMLLVTLDELRIPCHPVVGTLAQRLRAIAEILGLRPVMSPAEAIALAHQEYEGLDRPLPGRRSERTPAQV